MRIKKIFFMKYVVKLLIIATIVCCTTTVVLGQKQQKKVEVKTQTTAHQQQLESYKQEKLQFKIDYPSATPTQKSDFLTQMRVKYPLIFNKEN